MLTTTANSPADPGRGIVYVSALGGHVDIAKKDDQPAERLVGNPSDIRRDLRFDGSHCVLANAEIVDAPESDLAGRNSRHATKDNNTVIKLPVADNGPAHKGQHPARASNCMVPTTDVVGQLRPQKERGVGAATVRLLHSHHVDHGTRLGQVPCLAPPRAGIRCQQRSGIPCGRLGGRATQTERLSRRPLRWSRE